MSKQSFPSNTNLNSKKANSNATQPTRTSVFNATAINHQTTSLPPGWKREEILKPTGLYAGKTDIYYTSPTGQKIRSKAEMQKILGGSYDVSNFDWHSGKFVNSRKRPSTNENDSTSCKLMKMIEEYQQCLVRSGPSLFCKDKLPIIETTRPDSRINNDAVGGNDNQEVPKQIFWHKRLADNYAFNPNTNEKVRSVELPKEFQNAGFPGIDNNQLFQSIVSCIYNSTKNNIPVLGQSNHKASIEKNPCLLITANQPLVKQVVITDDIINRQEAKVKELRRKLELVRRTLLPKLSVDEAA
uniref:Methyl-CpG binding domain 2/3 n=1 Tax=Schmidtea mediterranea TaxID=79327 RepID=V5UX13_SCHMD|nr:methyl-CpG binding domain 2/3 [Schmidtea mediterranea]